MGTSPALLRDGKLTPKSNRYVEQRDEKQDFRKRFSLSREVKKKEEKTRKFASFDSKM